MKDYYKVEQLPEFRKFYIPQNFDPDILDYSVAENHIKTLEILAALNNSSIFINDYFKKEIIFYSQPNSWKSKYTVDDFKTHGMSLFFKLMHPDDVEKILNLNNFIYNFYLSLPKEQIKNYKLNLEYRVLADNGKYFRMVQQFVALELDSIGNVWLGLGINDISPNQDKDSPMYYSIYRISDGENYLLQPYGSSFRFYDSKSESMEFSDLTRREKEILILVSQGFASKNIADKLFISMNTVNNHRKNILSKTNSKNITQAISMAKKFGFI